MHEILHALKHGFIDTLKIAPLLIAVYFLIEFLEYKELMQFHKSKTLRGKTGPIFGALFGSLPQCGFSVISTDLFAKGFVSIGALLAVYVATSDEALPIMISKGDGWISLLALIGCKIVLAIIIGYLAMWLHPKVFKAKNQYIHDNENKHNHNHKEEKYLHQHIEGVEHTHEHWGCCKHDLESKKFDWKHPLLHSLKILTFILSINILFGIIVEFVGEVRLTNFLSQSSWLQPVLAVLIGLIPNCASSVVITELYLLGGLSFGAVLAGLSVNAGLGLMVLFKQDKNIKEIVFILALLIIPSLLAGYGLHFIV